MGRTEKTYSAFLIYTLPVKKPAKKMEKEKLWILISHFGVDHMNEADHTYGVERYPEAKRLLNEWIEQLKTMKLLNVWCIKEVGLNELAASLY